MAGTNCGSWFRIVSTPIVPVSWNALSSTVVIGAFAVKSWRRMRDPVTVISSRLSASSCAAAGAVDATAKTALRIAAPDAANVARSPPLGGFHRSFPLYAKT
jgi:hypothetical protein